MKGVFLVIASAAWLAASPAYVGQVDLRVELWTADGIKIPRGPIDVEVRQEAEHYLLFLKRNQKLLAAVNGRLATDIDASRVGEVVVPFMGTTFLQPKDQVIGTEEERRFSKSGRPMYEEATREWKATLRAYRSKSRDGKTVWLVFQERGETYDDWTVVRFPVRLD